MKKQQLILKIVSAVLCLGFIVPLFLNFITLKNGNASFSYTFAEVAGSKDALLVISRILVIASLVVAMVLMVSLILQLFMKNDIIDWVVVGSAVILIIIASLAFVSTLLYCVSVSKIGKYVWFPTIGAYILVALGLLVPIMTFISNKK